MTDDCPSSGRGWCSRNCDREGGACDTADHEAPIIAGLIGSGDKHLVVCREGMAAKNSHCGRGSTAGDASDQAGAIATLAPCPIPLGRVVDAIDDFAQRSREFDCFGPVGKLTAPVA